MSLTVFASYTRTQVLRPQLFSVLFFAVLLTMLENRERRPRVAAFGIPAPFRGVDQRAWRLDRRLRHACGVWLACDAIERDGAALVDGGLLAAASLAATLVNPYGVHQWTFLRQTVGLSRDISDWVPFFKLPPFMIAFELVTPGDRGDLDRRQAAGARDSATWP